MYHLAGAADVGGSWTAPRETFLANAEGTLNVLEAAAQAGVERVLAVTSADVYGRVTQDELPLDEDQPLRPVSPVRRVARSRPTPSPCRRGSATGCRSIRVRAFNHLGPGQSDRFVAPSLAARIARNERDGGDEVPVGNLTPRRDFTDVRDVVRAYRLLVTDGEPGEVYNVCRGRAFAVAAARRARSLAHGRRGRCAWCPTRRCSARSTSRCCVGDNTGCTTPPAGSRRSSSTRPSPTARQTGGPASAADNLPISRRRPERDRSSALITGITGQDGSYLAELLLDKGYEVVGMVRRTQHRELRAHRATSRTASTFVPRRPARRGLAHRRPAGAPAATRSTTSPPSRSCRPRGSQPVLTGEFTALGVTRLLDAIRIVDPEIRFYQASSSEMFGKVREVPQSETTPFYPRSPYGVAKVYGHWITVNYRESLRPARQQRILFNHECPRRGLEFVDPQDHQRRGPDQARPGRPSCASATSTPSATGASPATTSRRCG